LFRVCPADDDMIVFYDRMHGAFSASTAPDSSRYNIFYSTGKHNYDHSSLESVKVFTTEVETDRVERHRLSVGSGRKSVTGGSDRKKNGRKTGRISRFLAFILCQKFSSLIFFFKFS